MTAERPMTQDEQKRSVAREAIKYVEDDAIIGVGTGSSAAASSAPMPAT